MLNEHGLTLQQEKFARAVGAGKSQAAAFRLAYPASKKWKPESLWSKSSELASRVKVKSRIDSILSKAAADSEVTVGRITREAAAIAFANRLELTRWGPGALGNKVRAIELLARIAGAFKEDNKQKGDALAMLLTALPGNVIGANKDAALDAGDDSTEAER